MTQPARPDPVATLRNTVERLGMMGGDRWYRAGLTTKDWQDFVELVADQGYVLVSADMLARAIHTTKGGGPFGREGECECDDDAAAILAALTSRASSEGGQE